MELKPGYKMTEVGVIPEDWDYCTLGEGLSSKPSYGVNAPACEYKKGLFPYIRITDITDDGEYIPLTYVDVKNDNFYLKNGDIVLARTGASVGKSYRYKESDGKLIYAGFLICIHPNNIIFDSSYIFYYLHTDAYWKWVSLTSMRSGQPGINSQEYMSMLLPRPSLPEQQAIAAALSDVDELLRSLDQLIAKKKDIRLAAMQELLTGKTRLPGFDLNTIHQKTDLGIFPSDWKILPIHAFTECTSGGTPNTKIPSYWGGKHPWMSSGELHKKYIYNVSGRITDKGLMNSSTKYIPKNSVLIGLAGQGKTRGTVALTKIPLCINQSIAAIFPSTFYNSEYLFYNLNNRYTELREISSGDGGRGGLNLNLVNNICIPFPPLAEQQAIASVLSDMDAEIEALEARRDKVRHIKAGMMQELLTGKTRLISSGERA